MSAPSGHAVLSAPSEQVVPSAGLPKAERLSGRKDIMRLMNQGHWGGVPGLKYCFIYDSSASVSRFAVSVPKRLFKRAVKRNLLKRRLREAFRLQKELLPSEGGVDLMVVYNSTSVQDFETLRVLMASVLRQISE
ncbi:MAG: ribonuclease P protein component [Bacteroidales bacterium]|nr:ribonuclease P protein component [Bacteroidales bacterium]